MAAASGAPVMLLHCYREGLGRYRLMVDEPRYLKFNRKTKKAAQLHLWCSQYAARMAELARRYPYQWFNVGAVWVDDREPSD